MYEEDVHSKRAELRQRHGATGLKPDAQYMIGQNAEHSHRAEYVEGALWEACDHGIIRIGPRSSFRQGGLSSKLSELAAATHLTHHVPTWKHVKLAPISCFAILL